MNELRPPGGEAGPFHEGERAAQVRAGASDKIEDVGRRLIRDFMPEQHREFFAGQRLLVVAGLDAAARPWASALVGTPGFLHAPDPRRLHVAARPRAEDPLRSALGEGAAIGALGIELHTRRRNRLNGKVAVDPDEKGFTILVDQSFGNCPQYIQTRELRPVDADAAGADPGVVRADRLDCAARKIVQCADTCFIASHFGGDRQCREHGADVSHRGGFRGFVRILDDRTLEFPDYRGNFFFNTLGNLVMNPQCGLLFLSFTHGDVLQLTGVAEILWEFPVDAPVFEGAERVVRFRIEAMVRAPGAFPLRGDLHEYAPQLLALCHQRRAAKE